MAHELGHLLLGPNSHSRDGIMCHPWNLADLERAFLTQMRFTGGQAERMRHEVRARLSDGEDTALRVEGLNCDLADAVG